MNRSKQKSIAALVLGCVSFPVVSASGQVAEIVRIPNQLDRASAYFSTGVPVEAANGDVLVFYVESGMWTNGCCSGPGTSAQLMLTRSTDSGETWSAPETLRSAIDEYGTDGIWYVRVFTETTGRIFLTFVYKYAQIPNVTIGIETYYSDDSGASWLLASKNADVQTIGVSVLPSTAILGLKNDYDWDTGRDDYLASISTDLGASWSAPASIIQGGGDGHICDWFLHPGAEMEWTFLYSECDLNDSIVTFQMKTTDAGATWTSPEQIMTSNAHWGYGNNASLITDSDESLWLSYENSDVISYRKSMDGGDTWSDATPWTAGDSGEANCAPSTHGPMCVFRGKRGSTHPQNYFGFLGRSVDPLEGPVGIEDEERNAESVSLRQNYPNPFRGSTTIVFAIIEPTHSHLAVYDLLGREVAVLADGRVAAGFHQVVWNATGASHGVYFYRLTTESTAESRRLIVAN